MGWVQDLNYIQAFCFNDQMILDLKIWLMHKQTLHGIHICIDRIFTDVS